jgi:hypothetical protein
MIIAKNPAVITTVLRINEFGEKPEGINRDLFPLP